MSTNHESQSLPLGNTGKRERSIIARINRIATALAAGSAVGASIGLVIDIAVGSAAGSSFPGMGTIAGGIIGGVIGAIPLPRHKPSLNTEPPKPA